jgi:hypothetical protein
MRRSRTSAVKKMTAILASSDGWMPKPPTANHRRVPLIGAREQHGHEQHADHAQQRPDERLVAVVR